MWPFERRDALGAAALIVAVSWTSRAWEAPLVLTQVPLPAFRAPGWDADGLLRDRDLDGARVVVVTPDGAVRVLSRDFRSACDPDVSFDGQRVLFAGRKDDSTSWRIWEVEVDGQNLRAVTPEALDARRPIHATALFTLNSPEPWWTTVFVGIDRTFDEAGGSSASSLYSIRLDGTDLRRLTFSPNLHADPFQMADGRIVYSAARYPHEPGGRPGRLGLQAIHVEGADMEFYGTAQGRRIQQMACATAGGLVLFVESDRATQDGAGQLACVEERRPHVTYRSLTGDTAFAFAYPSPWRGNQVLVARRPAVDSGQWGIVLFDPADRRCEPIYDSPDHHDLQAVALQPRPRPDGHSTVVDTQSDSGVFYGLDAYDTDERLAPHWTPGLVQRVRFVEGVVQPRTKGPMLGPFVGRRLVGEAPVEPDGSFNVEVPADTPLLLQTLDAQGLALATCGWIWVKPKEKRGCIGCHEDPDRIPENQYVAALRRPSNRLVQPPDRRRTVSFRNDIAPLLRNHCATSECHGSPESPLHLPLGARPPSPADLASAYATLMKPSVAGPPSDAAPPRAGHYVDAGRARTSWLVWQMTGTNTARPWDRDALPAADPRTVKPMPPPGKGVPLRPEDRRTIIQWIDLGAPFDPPNPPNTSETKT